MMADWRMRGRAAAGTSEKESSRSTVAAISLILYGKFDRVAVPARIQAITSCVRKQTRYNHQSGPGSSAEESARRGE
jgi:hypothetical protein